MQLLNPAVAHNHDKLHKKLETTEEQLNKSRCSHKLRGSSSGISTSPQLSVVVTTWPSSAGRSSSETVIFANVRKISSHLP